MKGRRKILIVDDEKNILTTLSRALLLEGYDVDVAGHGKVALEKAAEVEYDLVLLDVMMPDITGLEVLRRLKTDQPEAVVLVMSGHGSVETAVEATRLGAHDFLEKPISTDRLLLSLSRALDFHELQEQNESLRRVGGIFDELLGQSAAMNALREQIERVADATAPVLLRGERGTGKELVARAIHRGSSRADAPMEKLNCAAVPPELIESELFGHESGAFTGATKQRLGKFERAHGGTLFLDEVGDMPLPMQAKLLRVLQEGELERVGGSKVIEVNVRVVAATNKNLEDEIEEGRFRADLHDRLNVLPLRLPPLRERAGDIALLAEHFLTVCCEANDRPRKSLSAAALDCLKSYAFPGNVRELRNVVERLVIMTPAGEITEKQTRDLMPNATRSSAGFYRPGTAFRELIDDAERAVIEQALAHHEGHVTNTAQDLGLERSHLYKKMKALGIR